MRQINDSTKRHEFRQLQPWACMTLCLALMVIVSGCGSSTDDAPKTRTASQSANTQHAAYADLSTAERMGLRPVSETGDAHDHAAHAGKPHPAEPDKTKSPHGNFGTGLKKSTGTSPKDYSWSVPGNWKEKPGSAMRIANLQVSENSECYFTVLSGDGGGLEANLNRWRAQMGLGAINSKEINTLPRHTLLGQEAVYIVMDGDFTGMGGAQGKTDYQLVGLARIAPDAAYFVKMVGPREEIEGEKVNLIRFASSLRKKTTLNDVVDTLHTNSKPLAEASALTWAAPEHWEKGLDKPMRLATYSIGETECYIASLSGGGGGLTENINRWRMQLGQEDLEPSGIGALPKVNILGQKVPFVEVRGTYNELQESDGQYMLLGAIRALDSRTLFVKMIGPEDQVDAESKHFKSFCESFQQ